MCVCVCLNEEYLVDNDGSSTTNKVVTHGKTQVLQAKKNNNIAHNIQMESLLTAKCVENRCKNNNVMTVLE